MRQKRDIECLSVDTPLSESEQELYFQREMGRMALTAYLLIKNIKIAKERKRKAGISVWLA